MHNAQRCTRLQCTVHNNDRKQVHTVLIPQHLWQRCPLSQCRMRVRHRLEFLMTHPVYPTADGCELAPSLFSQPWIPHHENAHRSSRVRFLKTDRMAISNGLMKRHWKGFHKCFYSFCRVTQWWSCNDRMARTQLVSLFLILVLILSLSHQKPS